MLSELYVENRLRGLARWAEAQGMRFRVQAIGSEINAGLAASVAPVPEGDNSNDIHGWRKLAAGRDIGGGTLLSDEAATFVGGIAHVATWRDALYMIQRDMAGGANQIVLHGFSHADAPGAAWPGFSAFGRAIGNDWGPRDPMWTMAGGVTAYLGRLQHILRQGRSQADLAVLGQPLRSQAVLRAGYTFHYPDQELLTLPQMALRGGRLMPGGPAYRALVINALPAIDLPVAERLRDHARGGFPVVLVGAPPARGRGWHDAAHVDRQIAAIFAKLAGLPTVRQVARQRDVPAALAALGLPARIGFSAPCRVLALHRICTEGEIFYLLNDSAEAVDQTLSLAAPGTAYRIDLWSGEICEAPGWQQQDGAVRGRLTLAANEPAVILVAPAPLAGAMASPPDPAGPPRALAQWSVVLDSWLPGATPAETRHAVQRLSPSALASWSHLLPDGAGRGMAGRGMAGTATYRATLHLAAARPPRGAVLDLGAVGGMASLSVNGAPHRVVNPFTARASIGAALKPGDNVIEITVAAPLNNRLLAEGIAEQGFKPPVSDDAADRPLPPPDAAPPGDPDLADGPGGLAGMQPGAAPPGSARVYREYGLLGPVVLRL